ncbi:uncharacterized protein EDB91DRAFT_1155830 [Suillus paluster]|uniref:uncharacterized protein n=1 Tax=Suillus paluster TaxID=48578 RepID=UPI001B85F61A|nr:uncharacterized protein EDB91DRAFT_1155830 [Suillus paluster]KAG1730967.1 hypothetical protein EDB91DRAFT_1155830 [Suillus paluster]
MSTADNHGRHTMHIGKSQKKISQQIYRSTEAEDFSHLRQTIQDVTQESPQTRHDILVKAAEIIKQFDRDYRSLLSEHAALTSTGTASSPRQQLAFYPGMSQFAGESWSANHGHQTMPMHPHTPPSLAHSMYAGQIMDDPTQSYPYFTYQ